jgi:hypothetical protein
MPPPVDFPRELFADALTEHARLVEVHADAILTAPLEERRVRDGDDEDGDDEEDDEKEREDHPSCRTLGAIDLTCSVLASDGALHELHKWRTQEVSFVVQRCHGIVRRLMQDPDDGFTYVVVVARGVASLQLLRGVEPKRGGDRERLEVAERDLAVEPWDQWHRRSGGTVTTWWRTPLGGGRRPTWSTPSSRSTSPASGAASRSTCASTSAAAWPSWRPAGAGRPFTSSTGSRAPHGSTGSLPPSGPSTSTIPGSIR